MKKSQRVNWKVKDIYNVGSLSLNDINNFKPNKNLFLDNFEIKDAPFVLVTFHPETVSLIKIIICIEMRKALNISR